MTRRKRHWVKVWPKMLHDFDIVGLDDQLWRRLVECFLVLGIHDSDFTGRLPGVKVLAFEMHQSPSQIVSQLDSICELCDVLERDDGGYFIPNWLAYQEDRRTTWKRDKEKAKQKKVVPNRQQLDNKGDTVCDADADADADAEDRRQKAKAELKTKDSAREKAKPEDVFQVVDYMQSYGQEKRYVLDFVTNGERFWDFYASKGWKVGNAAMKDWKSAARNWVRSQHERQSTGKANGIDRRSSQERANRLGVADVKDDAIGALRLIQAMRGETGHEESDGRDDTLFLGDGS